MCSSDFGPARLPSLVTWPMRNVVTPRPLARNRSWVATSRTWLMLPGADGKLRRVHRLHRVHDQGRRLELVDLLEDALEATSPP